MYSFESFFQIFYSSKNREGDAKKKSFHFHKINSKLLSLEENERNQKKILAGNLIASQAGQYDFDLIVSTFVLQNLLIEIKQRRMGTENLNDVSEKIKGNQNEFRFLSETCSVNIMADF